MKKIILFSLLAISILSCKKEDNEKAVEIKTETQNDTLVTEKMSPEVIIDSLKKGNFSKELSNYNDSILNEIAKNMTYEAAINGMSSGETDEFLKEITKVENNIISLYWETCATGGCVEHQKLLIKDNKVIDLGNGFDKMIESEVKKLETEIKSKIKNYSHISGRNDNEIYLNKNGNYLVSIRGLTDEDSEASGGSIEISYETKDLKTFIPSTLKIKSKN